MSRRLYFLWLFRQTGYGLLYPWPVIAALVCLLVIGLVLARRQLINCTARLVLPVGAIRDSRCCPRCRVDLSMRVLLAVFRGPRRASRVGWACDRRAAPLSAWGCGVAGEKGKRLATHVLSDTSSRPVVHALGIISGWHEHLWRLALTPAARLIWRVRLSEVHRDASVVF